MTLPGFHLSLGLHFPELENPLRPLLNQVEVPLPIEQGVAHLSCVKQIWVPRQVVHKVDLLRELGLGGGGREHIVGFEALIVSVDGRHGGSLQLKVEIDESLKLLVHVVHREEHPRRTAWRGYRIVSLCEEVSPTASRGAVLERRVIGMMPLRLIRERVTILIFSEDARFQGRPRGY